MVFTSLLAAAIGLASPCLDFARTEFARYLPESGIALELRVDAAMGTDAFRLRERAGGLEITGGTDRGCLYGVYSFLENEGGARFYASDFEIAPKPIARVPKGLDRTERPAFEGRCCFWYDACKAPFCAKLRLNFNAFGAIPPECGGGICRFGKGLGSCHTLDSLLPEDPRLCLSKEENYRLVQPRVLERIAADPEADFYGISYPDCEAWCRCPDCERINAEEESPAGTLVRFVNRLAADVAKKFHGKRLETLAYEHTIVAPKTPLATNVIVCLCSNECDFYRPIREGRTAANRKFMKAVTDWGRKSPLYVWNYTTDFCGYLMPFPNVRGLVDDIRFFRDNGTRWLFEQGNYQGGHGEFAEWKAYLIAKAMWNPDLDEKALREDFFRGYYGAGAPHLLAYLDYLDRRHGEFAAKTGFELIFGQPDPYPYLDGEFLRTARGFFDAAEKATRDDGTRNRHVRMSALTVDYLELRAAMAARPPDRDRLAEVARRFRAKLEEAGDVALLEYPKQLFGDLQYTLTGGGESERIDPSAELGDARWLWAKGEAKYVRFKCKFKTDGEPLVVHLPMDARSTLYLDCRRVARGTGRDGAARTLRTFAFDLMKGGHVLEVLVADVGDGARIEGVPGFALKADGGYSDQLTTGRGKWYVKTFSNVDALSEGRYRVAGHSPWGDFWDNGRHSVRQLAAADPVRVSPAAAVAPEAGIEFPGAFRDADDFNGLIQRGTPFTLPAKCSREVVWDLGSSERRFVELLVAGGAGTEIRWSWSDDGRLFGPEDVYLAQGSAMFEEFELPESRRGRYLRMAIRTADSPLTFKKLGVSH